MQAATTAKKPRKCAISGRFWAGSTCRGRIKDDHKIEALGGTGILFKDTAKTLRELTDLGVLAPGSVEELIKNWKDKKELYRKEFNYGWPAKLVVTSFVFEGTKYRLTPESFGLDEYNPWDHGLMECFQADLEADLRAMGATEIYSLGFID